MHPLQALGLERDADERAVKRAYAQRLRKARPDEDPAGFQKLHESYQAALSWLRFRAQNPDAVWWEDEDVEEESAATAASDAGPTRPVLAEAEFEALIGNPRYGSPAAEPDPPLARPEPCIERVQERAEPFRLDIDAFIDRVVDEAVLRDAASFRSFLETETGEWPIGAKDDVAAPLVYRLSHASEGADGDLLHPAQLDALVDVFGLDDVQSRADPLALHELRERSVAEHDRREREGRLGRLWRRSNRAELARYMAQPERGGHPRWFTRLVAWLLTNANAYEWAFALRPLPFVNRFVMAFIRDVDDGRLDVLGRYVDQMALTFWEWAEIRREANRRLRYAILIFGLFVAITYVTQGPPRAPSQGGVNRPGRTTLVLDRDRVLADRIRRAIEMDSAAALAEYDAILREATPPWSTLAEEVVAIAHYNRGVVLRNLGRTDEARASYETVDRLFSASAQWPVQLVTAKALVNLGSIQASRREFREVLATLGKVVARYGDIKREEFDLQVARALSGRAAAFTELAERDEARWALDDLLRRFGERTTGDLGELVGRARERRQALDRDG